MAPCWAVPHSKSLIDVVLRLTQEQPLRCPSQGRLHRESFTISRLWPQQKCKQENTWPEDQFRAVIATERLQRTDAAFGGFQGGKPSYYGVGRSPSTMETCGRTDFDAPFAATTDRRYDLKRKRARTRRHRRLHNKFRWQTRVVRLRDPASAGYSSVIQETARPHSHERFGHEHS